MADEIQSAQDEIAEHLSKKQLHNLEKKQKRAEMQKGQQKAGQATKLKKYAMIAAGALILGFLLLTIYNSTKDVKAPYTSGPVHWHAETSFSGCGVIYSFPRPAPGRMLGPEGLHTHDDGRVHIEQQVMKAEDISLGRYFDNVGVKFSKDGVSWGKVNFEAGTKCPDGKEGKLKMLVNGKENSDFRGYVIHDGDKIDLKFE